ncbi:unnamed protein product [marine sediment metagenome]|uniref:Uncharacterized protein n=1 Tax=marine sediment metagenome TaxID=412755 RepID=X1GW47_9ZZZZ
MNAKDKRVIPSKLVVAGQGDALFNAITEIDELKDQNAALLAELMSLKGAYYRARNKSFALEDQNAELLEALERHTKMFEMVCDKVDFGNAFLDAETIGEWNEASIQATEAIRKARGE